MAIRNPHLPFLPGFSPNPLLGRKSFGVRPIFETIDGVNMLIDKKEGEDRMPSLYARKVAPELPAWIVYDKQILRFMAYYQQTLHEHRSGPSILRRVDIYFYLEDGTIKVMEPRTPNSGMLQGLLISRQRIKLPFSRDNFYDVLDLNVGREVELFGKVFKIIDCDDFTRVFLNRLGIRVPDRESMPSYEDNRYANYFKPQGPMKKFPLKQFLDYDRQVLRFSGYWDDRASPFGTIHDLEIHYYLTDDTMEVKEILPPNSGREAGPMFFKKDKLYKAIPIPEISGGPPRPTYTPGDLIIGAVINLCGRKVVLTDCDAFTKEYYRKKFGIDDFTPQQRPQDNSTECVGLTMEERDLPPWNGYGSFDDSAQNCITVEPKAPRSDFMKFINLDRIGYDTHNLRFGARLISDVPDNDMRYFIITYYLADDTMAVFELAERNSGFTGGRMFKRGKIYLPGSEFFVPVEPPTYTAQDMWIGNELIIYEHKFRLMVADEYALRYMELHKDEFPKANIEKIMDKVRRGLVQGENRFKAFVAKYSEVVLPESKELMSTGCFRQAMTEAVPDLTEHEFVTLIRHYRGDIGKRRTPYREMIRSLVFSSLTRGLWDARERLEEGLVDEDSIGTGLIDKFRMRQIIRSHRLPLPDELIDCLLNVLDKADDCRIRWADLMDFLDFKTRPPIVIDPEMQVKLIRHSVPYKDIECQGWLDKDTAIEDGYVNWNKFVCDLNLEHLVKD